MIEETIDAIRGEIASFNEQYREILDQAREKLSTMWAAVDTLDPSASGSWMGYQASLYFRDFQKPPIQYQFDDSRIAMTGQLPPGWEERSIEDVITYVEEQTDGLTLDAIIPEIKPAFEQAKKIERLIETDLLPLQIEEHYAKEFDNLNKFLEKHRWEVTVEYILRAKMPKRGMLNDPTAVQQGARAPPHMRYEAGIAQQQLLIQSICEFIEFLDKFLRKIEVISKQLPASGDETAIVVISRLCDRFHKVARQLQNRHDSRETLTINDEYDVQDLLHVLLSIQFDDIRPEEYTPSYAGRSSRMDFLLKREQIVIETKKTRDGLDARKLGDELLIDIGHYGAHPNCRVLICFVYDPESRITNPRGIEDDLASCSTETLQVIPIIRP